ncbi:HIT domain-containing protein [Marinobacter salinisoli]|uniref:HIT domain-containing protein n=1 Tax=Marinobacter salinisoli TaxID=2769486 RepID=A0ABX7MNJ9_9GAMM|nr:HIT domain-containing protein [Marinobacter salinisoli]QSP93847.1 HIT domain-containing protein [Marinobacter salinisoli]
MDRSETTYTRLQNFIEQRMSMSHIYHPVMLAYLLEHHGEASAEDIAESILLHDDSQLRYYREIVKKMPGQVLAKHGIVEKGPRGSSRYFLAGYDELSPSERKRLQLLCEIRLAEYIEKRGKEAIFAHRDHSRDEIPGSLRYEALKRAEFRCQLCGVLASEKALEVDHIIPVNHGGTNDLNNLQALCYSCNAMKRDRDDTDFRDWPKQYEHRAPDCLFCHPEQNQITVLAENELALLLKDNFPVSPGHCLAIPRRHVQTYFDLNPAELNAINALLHERRAVLMEEDPSITGFNMGTNAGASAGQSVFHAHIHLIPRRDGDQENPRGGVRKVFPDKADY